MENEQPSNMTAKANSGAAIIHIEATKQTNPTDLLHSMMVPAWETESGEGGGRTDKRGEVGGQFCSASN